jgi:hypothetical protein
MRAAKEGRHEPELNGAAWVPQKRWTPQETWIWEQVLAGEVGDLNQRYGEAEPLDPKTDETTWHDPAKPRQVSERFLLDVLALPDFTDAMPFSGLRIVGAWFPAPLDLSNIVFAHQISLQHCQFNDRLSFRTVRLESNLSLEHSTCKGEVDLIGAQIGGYLDVDGATFKRCLDMNGLTVGRSLFLRATFEGNVDLTGARIEMQLGADTAIFKRQLTMNGLKVGQHLFLRGGGIDTSDGDRRATFKGNIDLRTARVDGDLDLSNATFRGGVDVSAAVIMGELRLGSSHRRRACWEGPTASLVLRNTSVAAVQDRIDKGQDGKIRDAWPKQLQLEGFAYRRLGGLGGKGESEMIDRPASWYVAWLERDQSFSPQPYRQLANVFREAGADEQANAILYALRERERAEAWRRGTWTWRRRWRWWRRGTGRWKWQRHGTQRWRRRDTWRSWWRWLGLTLLKWVIGYGIGAGYFRALGWAVLFTLIGTLVLRFGGTPPWFTPGWVEQPEGLEGFRWCAWASLDEILPLVELNKAHAEFVDKKLDGWRQDYFYGHRIIGYLLGSFVVAGLAGLTQGK